MSETSFRNLCTKLVAAFNSYHLFTDAETTTAAQRAERVNRAIATTVAALATPQQGEPSDEELDVLERQCWMPTEVCNDAGCEYLLNHRRFARAVLARYGAHPAPVAVAERLPGEGDCNEEGEVWVIEAGYSYALGDTGDYDWEPHRISLRPIGQFDARNGRSWLPHWALPLPIVE